MNGDQARMLLHFVQSVFKVRQHKFVGLVGKIGGGGQVHPKNRDQHLNLLFEYPNYLSGDSTNNG